MKLAKFRDPNTGSERVGRLDDEWLYPLDTSGRQYNSLFDILEADDPLEVIELLMRVLRIHQSNDGIEAIVISDIVVQKKSLRQCSGLRQAGRFDNDALKIE